MRKQRADLANNNLLNIESKNETWRISLRFPFTSKNDFGAIAAEVLQTAESTAENQCLLNSTLSSPKVIYTGNTYLFHHAQVTLLRDLFLNFLLAFVIITPILILVLKSVSLGLIAMLPNVFPTLIVFGGLGWFGHPVDLAIAMTACVA